MRVEELDYDLPEELIAQEPLPERDAARLLIVDRVTGALSHGRVRDLARVIPPSVVVVNDTRVIPARLFGRKETGGRVELLLLERLGGERDAERWTALVRGAKRLRPGARIALGDGDDSLVAVVEGRGDGEEVAIELRAYRGDVSDQIDRLGAVPLPPYIKRAARTDDRERYQTVYASRPGAVAAPTAGLHLSERVLEDVREAGHVIAHVTLHVGLGTFAPIRVDELGEHAMHVERYEVPERAAAAIRDARAAGRGVLAVGTTVVRALESAALDAPERTVRAGAAETRLFAVPGFAFRAVDRLLTNFHLPRSTLLALVMAFGGVETIRAAYAEAIRERYRFFSYGDAMLIL